MATIERTTDRDKDLTIFTATGNLSAAEVVGTLRQFIGNGPTHNIIWDLRAADISSVDTYDCRWMITYAKREAPHGQDVRSALVGDKDTSFGIVRMYETMAEFHGHPVSIAGFRSMQEAHDWLFQTPATIPTV